MTVRKPPNVLDLAIGDRIREIRSSADQTHAEMSDGIGVGELELRRIEAGRSRISKALLVKIARQYGVTVASMISPPTPARTGPSEDEISRLICAFSLLDHEARERVLQYVDCVYSLQRNSHT